MNDETIKELCLILDSDPLIDEVGIVLDDKKEEKFILTKDHKLGIFVSSLVPLLSSSCRGILFGDFHNSSRVAVLLNGDNDSAWTLRKHFLESTQSLPLDEEHANSELHLTDLALTRWPKSGETFSHRRWILQHQRRQTESEPVSENENELLTKEETQREMNTSEQSFIRYPMNYYAWQHRLWAFKHCQKKTTLIEEQLVWSEMWIRKHVSDSSGIHFREAMLIEFFHENKVANQLDKVARLWVEEFSLLRGLVRAFPGHESLWNHFRFLSHYWCFSELCSSHKNKQQQQQQNDSTNSIDLDESVVDGPLVLEQLHKLQLPIPSIEGMNRFLASVEQDKESWNFESQLKLVQGFRGWLKITKLNESKFW